MDVVLTTPAEAEIILSQVATSKLRVTRDVALCGESRFYWEYKGFHTVLGTLSNPIVQRYLTILSDESESVALSKTSILSRASAINSSVSVSISEPKYVVHPDSVPASSEAGMPTEAERVRGADAPCPSGSPL